MNETTCLQCGRRLKRDEVALHRKLVSRGAQSFLCLSCLSQRFKVDEKVLEEKIRYFRESGCTLFFI